MSEIVDADEWADTALREWAAASEELEDCKDAPHTGEASLILYTAKLKRAERVLAIANIKAEAASLIQQLRRYTTEGTVTIVLPEINLDIKMSW